MASDALTAPQAEVVARIRIEAPVSPIAGSRANRAAQYAHDHHTTLTKAAQLHGCSLEAARIAYAELFPAHPRIAV